jgi:hypothetical protein
MLAQRPGRASGLPVVAQSRLSSELHVDQVWISMRPLLACPILLLGLGCCGGAIFTRCKANGNKGVLQQGFVQAIA